MNDITNNMGILKSQLNTYIHEEITSNRISFYKCILGNSAEQFHCFNKLQRLHCAVFCNTKVTYADLDTPHETQTHKVKYITIPKLSSIVHSASFLCHFVQI